MIPVLQSIYPLALINFLKKNISFLSSKDKWLSETMNKKTITTRYRQRWISTSRWIDRSFMRIQHLWCIFFPFLVAFFYIFSCWMMSEEVKRRFNTLTEILVVTLSSLAEWNEDRWEVFIFSCFMRVNFQKWCIPLFPLFLAPFLLFQSICTSQRISANLVRNSQ